MEIPERIVSSTQYRQIPQNQIIISTLFRRVGLKRVEIKGNSIIDDQALIRGDLSAIVVGEGTHVCENVVIHPSIIGDNTNTMQFPEKTSIGKCSFLGKNSIIYSLSVGNYVYIGENCVLDQKSIVHNNVKILDNSYVPKEMVLIEGGIYGGNPVQYLGNVSESHQQFMEYFCSEYKKKLVIKPGGASGAKKK